MTKATMSKNYRKFAAHDAYLIELERDKMAYVVVLRELMPRMICTDHAASSRGGGLKLKVNIKAKDRDYLIAHNCILSYPVGTLPTDRYKNKGRAFECFMWEQFGFEGYHPDQIGFWHDGDLTIEGIKFQLKRNGAQIVMEQTLETLKAFHRLGITPPETFTKGMDKKIAKLKAQKKALA